jgi:hypothetical protein
LPVKWIAPRVQIATAKGAKSLLHRSRRGPPQLKPTRADQPCARLEFQWVTPLGNHQLPAPGRSGPPAAPLFSLPALPHAPSLAP